MSSTNPNVANAEPSIGPTISIADRIAESKDRADALFSKHREWLRQAHQTSRQNDSTESSQLCEELDQRRQQWLEIQDRVCQQQESFWQEFEQREAALLNPIVQADHNDELESLRTELAEWQSRCLRAETEAETALQQAAEQQYAGDADSAHHEALLDQAETLAELHELRDENESLRKQLAQESTGEESSQFNWEQHKQQLLNQLDGEDGVPPQTQAAPDHNNHLAALAKQELKLRNEEIEELKRRLAEQSEQLLTMEERDFEASSSPPVDIDKLVEEEQKKLEALQAEWREMLRKAEVEISIERAKLARDKRNLENEVGGYQDEISSLKRDVENLQAGRETSRGGNWLSRLGLGGQK